MCDAALRLLREEVTGERGGDQRSEEATKNDNIIFEGSQGTTKDYTLDRLAREDAKANRPPFGFTPASPPFQPAQQVGTNRQYVSGAKRESAKMGT
jgi:hypothetical protein